MSLTVSPIHPSRFSPWVKALSSLGLLTVLGYASGAIAQPILVPPAMQSSDAATAHTAQQFLFVNPSSGDDAGQGITQRSPFRTLTRALQAVQSSSAQSSTIIMLAAGTYTSDTGEVFPLIMPPGATIQGDPGTKGQSIVIQGGGSFVTATAGQQNVAIVGTGQIMGVTVSNPNGYGVWIEASSPIIANNTFTGSTFTGSHSAGVAIMGTSTPTLWGNTFSHNRAGIVVAATAQPVIKDSLDQVGAATPAVSAAPAVSLEQRNSRSSVAIAQATPPRIRRQPSATLIQTLPDQSTVSEPRATSESRATSEPRATPPATVASRSLNSQGLNSSARSAALQSLRTARPSIVNVPVPAPQSERRRDLPVSRSTPIPVPPPEVRAASASSFTALPAAGVQSNLLRVPAEPPIGNVGDLPVVNVARNPLQYRESSRRQSAAVRGLRYRVVVAAGRRAEKVRSLFPGAFTTYSGGEAVLQVGAFGDRTNAEEAAQILDSNGLNGTIEALDN